MHGEDFLFLFIIAVVCLSAVAFPIWLAVQAIRKRQKAVPNSDRAEESSDLENRDPGEPPIPSLGFGAAVGSHSKKVSGGKRGTLSGEVLAVLRLLFVGCAAVIMVVPLMLVSRQIEERASRNDEAVANITASWGGAQVLSGPILVVPLSRQVKKESRYSWSNTMENTPPQWVTQEFEAYILPKTVAIDVALDPQKRSFGAYSQLLYTAHTSLRGAYDLQQSQADFASIYPEWTPQWDRARVVVQLSENRSLAGVERFSLGEQDKAPVPGQGKAGAGGNGLIVPLPLNPLSETKLLPFDIILALRGSDAFDVAAVGNKTVLTISSSWADPSFRGAILPSQREVGETGFRAQWTLSLLSRSYPQIGYLEDLKEQVGRELMGVSLFEPVNLYTQLLRATKYGLLFIILTYAVFLAFEFHDPRSRIHLVQYGLIGGALSVFFLTLLALSEHIGFALAYLTASVLIVSMVGGYVAAALRSLPYGVGVGGLLVLLYAALYVILQQDDFALLTGTGLIIVVLAALMAVTRGMGQPKPVIEGRAGVGLRGDGVINP